VDDAELHQFYLDFVGRLRERGVLCAITSGLACVHFGIAETTKDCDLLCHPSDFSTLLNELSQTAVGTHRCSYRGLLSPPLDERWHRGGWTSHFVWGRGPGEVTLDVFGRALRSPIPWEGEILGLFVSQHVVAEMKRTNRDKDWPFITALGTRLLQAKDPRGWLHIFNGEIMRAAITKYPCPHELTRIRPALVLACDNDRRLEGALNAERKLWEQLDRLRMRIYQHALRPYVVAMRKLQLPDSLPLLKEHRARLECAETHLAKEPLRTYGIARHIEEAKQSLIDLGLVPPSALEWLPDVAANFAYLQHA